MSVKKLKNDSQKEGEHMETKPVESVSYRLNKAMNIRNIKQAELSKATGIAKSSISLYVSGRYEPKTDKIYALAKALDISPEWLAGFDVSMSCDNHNTFPSPGITDDYSTFPVIGEIAAGYDKIAVEDWDGDKIDIPNSYLKGHKHSEFFVLRVTGDSMYPVYQDGDKVLLLKQSSLNRSGEIGAIIYEDEEITLKKIEYVMGEDWLNLVPLNPIYPPKLIEGEALEHCRVIGVPRLLIREIEQ